MEWIEVIDRALMVLLGSFGGVVASLATVYVALKKPRIEAVSGMEKEYIFRRRDLLQEISEDFEKAHMHHIMACEAWKDFIKSGAAYKTDSPQEITLEEKMKEASNADFSLYRIESKLRLFGLDESAKILSQYSETAQPLFRPMDTLNPYKKKYEIDNVLKKICQLKDDLYRVLSRAYRSRTQTDDEA